MSIKQEFSSRSTTSDVMSVSELNQSVTKMLERNFPLCWIKGEVSNFSSAASGHWYFTLKDHAAQVRAVMFRGRAQYSAFVPIDGQRIEVRALVTLYTPRGDYQLNVEALRLSGQGDLHEAFLRLKSQLLAEGMLDEGRKRSLPNFVKNLGIITSAQGAALHDVLATLKRRAPDVQIIIYPTPVQGDGAAQKIALALSQACKRNECDVLLLCRGGGSSEDLSAFNQEVVARALIAATLPVIAGIGHETDVTIADLIADLRAATPTAAAELATTPRAERLAQLQLIMQRMRNTIKRKLTDCAQAIDWIAHRLRTPKAALSHWQMRITNLNNNLSSALQILASQARIKWITLQNRLSVQQPNIVNKRRHLYSSQQRLKTAISQNVLSGTVIKRHQLNQLTGHLQLLSPQRTLERGYAILRDQQGKIFRSPNHLKPHQSLQIQLAEGNAEVILSSVEVKSS